MKVWVLAQESNCCGAYLVGVYSSREKAQAVKDERHNPDDVIEEHELDGRLDWRYGPVFRFEIQPLEGDSRTYAGMEPNQWRHPEQPVVTVNGPVAHRDRHQWLRAESPISPEHAEQVARRRHEEWLGSR